MANKNSFCSAVVAAVLVMCVGFSAAVLVRSTPPDSVRVYDFAISANKDAVSWTAFGRRWNVFLELSDVVEDNTDYFFGTLEGDSSAVVSFSLLPGSGLSGMIITNRPDGDTGRDTWWIRALPVPENGFSAEERDLGVFMQRDEAISFEGKLPSFSEPLHDEEPIVEEAVSEDTDVPANERRRAVTSYKVGVFYDQKWALSTNPWSFQANTMGLLNDVNAIYRAAGLKTFSFVYLKQVANAKTTLNDMLNHFSNTASTNIAAMKDTSYTNYLWLVGSNVGGLAYVGTTCQATRSAQNRKTAVAGLVSYSRLWTVKTIAHELGHNRGANHEFTNACSSTVKTGCQCSVMSYCFPDSGNNPKGAVNFFSDFSINEMKAAGCN